MSLINANLHPQVIFSTSCQLVTPKHVVAGTLRLTNLHLQFVGDPPSEEQPLPGGTGAEPRSAGAAKPARTHKRWPVSAITELHHARFLLQQSALEIFLADRSNALLNFDGNEVGGLTARHSTLDTVYPECATKMSCRQCALSAQLKVCCLYVQAVSLAESLSSPAAEYLSQTFDSVKLWCKIPVK